MHISLLICLYSLVYQYGSASVVVPNRAVVVIKWSVCSPSTPMILFQSLHFSFELFEKNENKQKEAGDGP